MSDTYGYSSALICLLFIVAAVFCFAVGEPSVGWGLVAGWLGGTTTAEAYRRSGWENAGRNR